MENNEIDYVLINEYLADYMKAYQYHPYVRNLPIYGQKTLEVLACGNLDQELKKIKFETPNIDFVEGISLIKEYLCHLSPSLEEEFDELFKNGVINIEYVDDPSVDDDDYQEKDTKSYCFVFDVKHWNVNVANGKTNIAMLSALLHEFFHTTNVPTSDQSDFIHKACTEFISIYFEFDFLNYLIAQRGYDPTLCFDSYRLRYGNTISLAADIQDISVYLYKKQVSGVIDQYSYQIPPFTCDKKIWDTSMLKFSNHLQNFEKKQKLMEEYSHVFEEEKKENPFEPHVAASYVLGVPLAYYLSKSNDPNMPYKMIDFNSELNVLPFEKSLAKIGFKSSDIVNLNYVNVMNSLKNDIRSLSLKNSKPSVNSFHV